MFKIVGLNSAVFSLCAFSFLISFSCDSTETLTVSDLGILLYLVSQAVAHLCAMNPCMQNGQGVAKTAYLIVVLQ